MSTAMTFGYFAALLFFCVSSAYGWAVYTRSRKAAHLAFVILQIALLTMAVLILSAAVAADVFWRTAP